MAVSTQQLPAEDADLNNRSMSGPMHSGCRVGDFPATVEVAVESGMPEELRDRFPPGSALQFVLDGDRIAVFSDSPEEAPAGRTPLAQDRCADGVLGVDPGGYIGEFTTREIAYAHATGTPVLFTDSV